jgi:hypothetical protein
MQYVCKNLEDIALFFESQSKRQLDLMKGSKPAIAKGLKREAYAWQAAADFIRNVKIEPGE